MGLEDLTTLDETYPKGNIETVSVLDNYQRETRSKLKAWAAVEHDPATGHHLVGTAPAYVAVGRMYYDKLTSELRYYMTGPPGINQWRSVIQPPFNYAYNPEFKLMSDGGASAPCGWVWSAGAGQTIFQDPNITYPGKNSILLRTPAGGSVPNYIAQAMSTSNPRFLPIDYWRGRTISLGCYVICDVPNKAYIQLYDGVQTVNSAVQTSGSGAWDWCVVTMTVSAGATDLYMYLVAPTNPSLYDTRFSEPTLVEGAWCTRPVPQGHPQRSTIVMFNSLHNASQSMTGTNYYGPIGRSGNEFLASVIIPYRFSARNLAVNLTVAPGGVQSLDFKVRYNNTTDSNIGCIISGTATSGVDDTHTLMGAANGTLSLRCIGGGAPAASVVNAYVYVDELPW
jgi:hypothetical protein